MDETSCGYKASITKAGFFGMGHAGVGGSNCGNPMKSIEIQTFFGTGHRALLAERNVHRKRVVPALWRSHI
jgi:hypothetical protein